VNDIASYLPSVLPVVLVLARVSGLFIFTPILSSPTIPGKVKTWLVVMLTLAVYPALVPTLTAQGFIPMTAGLGQLVFAIMFEMLIGIAIGLIVLIPFIGIQLGGLSIGQQMGLAMAREFDPTTQIEGNVVGQILFYLALLAYLALGGLEITVGSLLHSFSTIPIGGFRVEADLIDLCVGLLTTSFEIALRIAAPILCLVMLQTFSLASIAKTAPAFNILSLGFPLRVMLGLGLVIVSVEMIYEIVENQYIEVLELLMAFVSFAH